MTINDNKNYAQLNEFANFTRLINLIAFLQANIIKLPVISHSSRVAQLMN